MTKVAERNVQTIDAEIAQKRHELQNVQGRETEVYARIVGYYRSVRNWNKGKREEYDHRKMFEYEHEAELAQKPVVNAQSESEFKTIKPKQDFSIKKNDEVSYEFFSRKTCPNCPSVKEYLSNTSITGKNIDVDTIEGLERARELQILSAPTVIVFDSLGQELARAQSVKELSGILELELTVAS